MRAEFESPVTNWADVHPRTGRDESEPRIVETREGRLAFHAAGEDRPGLPLVLLHGFTGHRDDFVGVAPILARDRPVVAPDLRGHGDSTNAPGRSGFGFDQLVADLVALLDALGFDRVDLLGHSVGGMIAVRFALAHPDRLRSIVFMCTAPAYPERMSPAGWELAAAYAEAEGMEELQPRAAGAVRRDGFPGLATWGDPERYYEHHRRRHLGMTPETYRGIGETFFRSKSVVDRLGEIACPCRVLVGEDDHEWIPGYEAFAAHLPDVQARVVPSAEHHPHQENPAVFFAELADHFQRVESDAD